jgi:hypothetical protein
MLVCNEFLKITRLLLNMSSCGFQKSFITNTNVRPKFLFLIFGEFF